MEEHRDAHRDAEVALPSAGASFTPSPTIASGPYLRWSCARRHVPIDSTKWIGQSAGEYDWAVQM